MPTEWYYAIGGRQNGPVPSDQLKLLARAGVISRADLVWREGLDQWIPAVRVKGLFDPSMPAAAPVAAAPAPVARQPSASPASAVPARSAPAADRGDAPDDVYDLAVPDHPVAVEPQTTIASAQYPRDWAQSQGTPGGTIAYYTPETATGQLVYAGFWLRVCASLIDGFILIVTFCGLSWLFCIANAALGPEAVNLSRIFGTVLSWLYFAIQEASPAQATLGKRAVGICVTDMHGAPITFARASGRYFAKYISMITFMIGYLLAAFTPQKQALHDIIAGCLVVRRI